MVFAERAAEHLKRGEGLAIGMQRFAAPADKTLRSPDRLDLVLLVFFGNRWKAHNLPPLLREHMADEIVFVQSLHNDDDGACR
jgi:hypothetical protein